MSLGEKNTSEVLGNLQNRGDDYTKAAIIEKKRLEELEDALRHITNEIEKYRSKAKSSAIDVMNLHILTPNPAYSRADGVDVEKQAKQVTSKVLNVLEMKLNKLLQRKSEVLNKNKLLKLEIDHMRRLRLQTDDSHAKFDAQLKQIKENIESMLRESNEIVIRREEILVEVERLEKRNKEEQAVFEVEYEAMGRFIKDQNIALESALLKERKEEAKGDTLLQQEGGATGTGAPALGNGVSDSTMNNDNAATSSSTYPGRPSSSSSNYQALSLDAEIEMANKVGTLTKFVSTEQSSLANIQSKIGSYENMFEQLKRLTNANSLREVASTYAAQEEEMFSLYNYAQTVNTEIEAVLEDRQRINDEIKVYEEQQKTDEIHRNKILHELQQRHKTTRDATIAAIEANKVHQECVDQLSKKLQVIFSKLQCDQMDNNKGSQQGGASKGKGANSSSSRPDNKISMLTGQSVTESNVLDYMAAIEQRAVDIISEYLITNQTDVGGNKYPTPGPSTPMRPGRIHVDLNEANIVDELEDGGGPTGLGAGGFNNLPPIGSGGPGFANDSGFGNANSAAGAAASLQAMTVDADSRPVDLMAFKERLRKRKPTNTSGVGSSNNGPMSSLNSPSERAGFYGNTGGHGRGSTHK